MTSTLGLFHNEILNEKRVIEVFEELPNLRDLSIDGNPVSAKISFKYDIIYRFKQLEKLDEEPLKELDRDIAEQYFTSNRCNPYFIYLIAISTLTRAISA